MQGPFSMEQQNFLSNQTVMDQKQLIELPQLDSPTETLAVKQCNQQQQYNEEYCSEERSNNNSGQGIDWDNLLFSSQFTDASYFSHQNLPLMNDQLQAQNILGCFPDS